MHRIIAWGDRKTGGNFLLRGPYIPDGEGHRLEGDEKAGPEGLDQVEERDGTDLKIELVNGSTIELKGTENAMALRGRSLAGVVLDEAAFMSSEVWFEVIRPALADKQGWALFISTPDGTASWFYELWQYADSGDTDWNRWQFTTIDGDNVPPEEIEAARAQLDARTFRQEFEASRA
jgi:phage FluMu gp28-like protein